MDLSLQIVCFNVPYPPNYGGAIDVYFKIKALSDLGVDIRLHCFTYDQYQPASELHRFCSSIHYYRRAGDIFQHMSAQPFIITSRKSRRLLKNISSDASPILFEGIHTTGFVDHDLLQNHKKMVRMHNVESAYYKKLSKWEKNVIKSTYLQLESTRLANYEERLYYSDATFLTISNFDQLYYSSQHRGNVCLIYPFHPFQKVESKTGSGKYVFLHADFSISDNKAWVEQLIEDIYQEIAFPIIIAGKNADQLNVQKNAVFANIQIESNVSQERMFQLIQNAHINIVQAFNSEGFKLKLLYSLFLGRHCIANNYILKGTELNDLCHQANSPSEVLNTINKLELQPFENKDIELREEKLMKRFSNLTYAQKIVDLINNGKIQKQEICS
jgi:hypothetical protein